MNRLATTRARTRFPALFPALPHHKPSLPSNCVPRRVLTTALPPPRPPPSSPSHASLLFFGIPIATTFSLGIWQLLRLRRKLYLIDDRESRLSSSPLPSSALPPRPDLEYHRVHVRGRFRHDLEMLVGPRSAPKELPTPVLQWGGSSGLQVLTPLELEGGESVLVNRGWVPHRLADPRKRDKAAVKPLAFLKGVAEETQLQRYGDGEEVSEEVAFVAVVRGRDERNRFTPENKAEKDEWYHVDPEAMLREKGMRGKGLVELLEPLPEEGWPYPKSYGEYLQFRTPPSTHVTYATTWFCLSAALALLTRNRLRHGSRSARA